MANISKLSQLINGVQRQVDLSANNLVVGSLQLGSSGNTLTNAILGNLIHLQDGSDFADGTGAHTHDGRYFQKAEIESASSGSAGSTLVGDDNSYSNITPAAATVKGALSGIDSAIGAEISRAEAAESTLQSNIDSEVSRAEAEEATFVKLDGSRAMTGALDLGSHKIVNVSNGTASGDAVNKSQLDAEASARSSADTTLQSNIDAEVSRAEAAEAALQSAIDAAASGLSWRPGAKAITADAGLNSAADGTALSTLLPFSDDESPQMVIGDFADGDYIISENGASSKVFKVYDDAGTLKVTTSGVQPLAAGQAFMAMNNLLDSAPMSEGVSIFAWNGSDFIKVADMDWSLATGISLSSSYAASAGTVAAGDSIEAAIQKLVANLAAEASARASADTTLQSNIDAEVSRAESAESTLQSNIDAEASARAAEDLTFIKKDGSRAFTADQSMGSHKLTNLADGTASNDAVNKSQLDAEASARAAADTTLQSNIDAEVSRAEAAEAALDTRVTALESGSGLVAKTMVCGESFAANTSFAVRMGMDSLGEDPNKVYKADRDASSADKFYVIGLALDVAAKSAGDSIKVIILGTHVLGSSDSAFSSSDVGKAVWLAASGAFSVTPPSASGQAAVKIGMVQDTDKVLVDRQMMGIN